MPSTGGIGALLKNHDFVFLWLAQLFSQLANNALLFVLAIQVYELTGSNTAVSGIFLVYGIPAVIFGMIAGSIVDKLENRSVLLVCDIVRTFLAIGFIFFLGNLPMMYLLTLVNAVITQFYVPAEAPAIPRLVKKDQLVIANSLFAFTYYSSLAVGSIVAGPILRWFGTKGVFFALAILFVLAANCVLRVRKIRSGLRPLPFYFSRSIQYLLARLVVNVQDGISYVQASRPLTDALTLLICTQVILAILGVLGPGFADRVLEIDIHDASVLITGPAVLGIIIGSLWVGNVGYKIRQEKLIQIGILSAGIMLVIISLSVRLSRVPGLDFLLTQSVVIPLEFILFFLLGVANSLLDVPANTILQEEARGDVRGRVYGMLTAAVGGVGILPVIIGGVLADVLGTGKVILLLGLLVVVYAVRRIKYNKR